MTQAQKPDAGELIKAIKIPPDIERAKMLITQGADPNEREPTTGRTALQLALSCDGYSDGIKSLRAMKPVAADDKFEITRLLIEKGAEIDAADNGGQTPLIYAVRFNKSALPFLIAEGADPYKKDIEGRTAMDWAEFVYSPEAKKTILDAIILRQQMKEKAICDKEAARHNTAAERQDALKKRGRQFKLRLS